jgi:hypothetical protein
MTQAPASAAPGARPRELQSVVSATAAGAAGCQHGRCCVDQLRRQGRRVPASRCVGWAADGAPAHAAPWPPAQAHLRTFMRSQQLQREVQALEAQLQELRARPAVQQALGQPAVAKKLEALGLSAECAVYEAETRRWAGTGRGEGRGGEREREEGGERRGGEGLDEVRTSRAQGAGPAGCAACREAEPRPPATRAGCGRRGWAGLPCAARWRRCRLRASARTGAATCGWR